MNIFLCTILSLGTAQLDVEIADTNTTRNRGLMYRKALDENRGMLFVYEQPELLCFWMKNTHIPLTIGFFDAHCVLMQTEDMDPINSLNCVDIPLYKSKKPAQYALEVPIHWFKRNKIAIGDKFTLTVE